MYLLKSLTCTLKERKSLAFLTMVTSCILLICIFSVCKAAESEEAVYMEYNELRYEKERDLIILIGNVVIVRGPEVLMANEAYYDRKNGKYYAKGEVALLREDGSVYFMDIVNLDKFLGTGKGINFRGRFAEQASIASSSVELCSRDKVHMNNAVFSSCKICKDNIFPNVPLWQIRANELTLDRKEESLRYKGATLELLGAPIFYAPYLVTAAPGAKRKSGFLFPTIKWSDDLGYSFRDPYYWNIAPSMDATTTVRLYTKSGPLIEAQFRHLLENGEYEINVSGIYSKVATDNGSVSKNKQEFRGHYNFKSLFKLDNSIFDTYIGLDSARVYDKNKTYLKKYHITEQDTLTTDAFLRNYSGNNYLFLDTMYFQGLNVAYTEAAWGASPRILPWVRGHFDQQVGSGNGSAYIDIDGLNLHRSIGSGYQRFSSTIGYNVPMNLKYGQLLQLGASVRGDYYQVNNSNSSASKGDVSRFYPQLALEWSLPLINHAKMGTFVVGPMAKLIIAPNLQTDPIMPNEDSQFFEISALNLMSTDRYLGLDRLEVGSRLNYGITGSVQTRYIRNIDFTMGEVLNFSKHKAYGAASGLDGKRSDYVSQISVEPISGVYLLHNLRLNNKDLTVMRNEVSTFISLPKWNLSASYMEVGKKLAEQDAQLGRIYRQDVMSSISYNIYDKWWVGARLRRKLGKTIPGTTRKISDGIHMNYLGDCLHTFFSVERDHTRLKDLKPSTTYALNIRVPGL